MRRVIVAGGTGRFGGAVAEALRANGRAPRIAGRSAGADLTLDVEDDRSLREVLRPGDVVVDTAGPFQLRTPRLVEAAVEIGFDTIDLADSLDYVEAVYARDRRLRAAGARVLTACSTVSTLTAALVARTGIERPARVRSLLVAASRRSAAVGSARSLLASVGRPVRVLERGRLVHRIGWRHRRAWLLPPPLGRRCGRLVESADAVALARAFPGLADAALYIDTNVPGLNALLDVAARRPRVARALGDGAPVGVLVGRALGRKSSAIACEVEGADGGRAGAAWTAPDDGHRAAVLPAGLAVERLLGADPPAPGAVGPDGHVERDRLEAAWAALGGSFTSD